MSVPNSATEKARQFALTSCCLLLDKLVYTSCAFDVASGISVYTSKVNIPELKRGKNVGINTNLAAEALRRLFAKGDQYWSALFDVRAPSLDILK